MRFDAAICCCGPASVRWPSRPGSEAMQERPGSARGEARSRPAIPKIDRPIPFNTPEADRILEDLQVFPPDDPWNQDVSRWPVHPNSRNIVASIGRDKPLAVQPGHELHPGAARPEARRGQDHGLSRRVGPGPVPRARRPADRGLAGRRQGRRMVPREDARGSPARRAPAGGRPARDRGRSGPRDALRVLHGAEDRRRLGGRAGLDLRPQDQPAPPRRLDLHRRRGAADLPVDRPPRRARPREDRPRPAGHGPASRAGPTSTRPATSPAGTATPTCPAWASASASAATTTSRASPAT